MGKVLRRNPPTLWRNGLENFPLHCMTYIFSCRKIFAFFIIGSAWAIRCSEEKVLNRLSCWMYVNIDPISAPDTMCYLSFPSWLLYLGHDSEGTNRSLFPGEGDMMLLRASLPSAYPGSNVMLGICSFLTRVHFSNTKELVVCREAFC